MNLFPDKMKYILLLASVLWNGFFLVAQSQGTEASIRKTHIESLIQNLKDSKNDEVIVVAHRAGWRNAPENSLLAIQKSIELGVDMVEIDVQKTSDGHLVLMHDKKINRTSNGKGRIRNRTLAELKNYFLRDADGELTQEKIPTLEEALSLAKDKILVNLDKSYPYFEDCYVVIEKTHTTDQVLMKGITTRAQFESKYGKYADKVLFMPVVHFSDQKAEKIVSDYMEHHVPVAFEFSVPDETMSLLDDFEQIRQKGASIWVNAIRPKNNAGNDDQQALENPEVYDWYIKNHIDIIQTDRPQLLLDYLRGRGLHK